MALFSFALIFVTPQVKASDRDVGLSYVLPADNATPVAIDCQACINFSFEYVTPVELRDPGDMRMQLSVQSTGLRAKSPDISMLALTEGDLTELRSDFRDQHGTRLMLNINRCNPTKLVISTSNGGAGY
jgi:hypothetical protein